MSIPTNKELLEAFRKINEGPEDNEGFQAGKDAGAVSKDTHSKPVTRKTDAGVKDAPKEYTGKSEGKMETDGGNKRDAGADKAPDKFEGSDKSVNDKTDQKKTEGGPAKVAAAEGASKEFSSFRDRIRAKMGLSLDDKLNKGNDGKIH
jgi:hypothetical protein